MRKGEDGQVLVVVVLAFAVILGFAALAIDIGYVASVRSELQRCADSGALAGAYVFIDPAVLPGDKYLEAMRRAEDYTTKDAVAGYRLNGSETDVRVFPDPGLPENTVRVQATRTVGLFFARAIGVSQRTVTVQAAARGIADPGPPPDNIVQLVE